MSFFSILYQQQSAAEAAATEENADIFTDLHLDQIIRSIMEGKGSYDLKPFYCSPLKEAETIVYRQRVMQDVEKPPLMACLKTFAADLNAMRTLLAKGEKYFYDYQKERAFLDAVNIYCDAVSVLSDDLSKYTLQSEGFRSFHDYLKEYLASSAFISLAEKTKTLLADLEKIRYNVLIDGLTVSVLPHHSEPDYSREVADVFKRFQFNPTHDYTEVDEADAEMNQVEAWILKGVATLYPQVFQRLLAYPAENKNFQDSVLMRFDREIQFYISFAEYIGEIKDKGLPFCFPQISEQKDDIFDVDTYDLALTKKLCKQQKDVVCNDFHLKGTERVIIVTGPNQGGKTTFARTFGQVHYFASLGLPVPGSRAKLLLYDHLYTHFERSEEVQSHRSKFEDDLIRVHTILDKITGRSIVILNEIFSSTSLEDAIFLCKKIMEKISATDTLCLWVTFIDELVSYSDKTVSMVSLVDKTAASERTFKIVRRKSDAIAYALSIAEKYRVTYPQLKKRLSS